MESNLTELYKRWNQEYTGMFGYKSAMTAHTAQQPIMKDRADGVRVLLDGEGISEHSITAPRLAERLDVKITRIYKAFVYSSTSALSPTRLKIVKVTGEGRETKLSIPYTELERGRDWVEMMEIALDHDKLRKWYEKKLEKELT